MACNQAGLKVVEVYGRLGVVMNGGVMPRKKKVVSEGVCVNDYVIQKVRDLIAKMVEGCKTACQKATSMHKK